MPSRSARSQSAGSPSWMSSRARSVIGVTRAPSLALFAALMQTRRAKRAASRPSRRVGDDLDGLLLALRLRPGEEHRLPRWRPCLWAGAATWTATGLELKDAPARSRVDTHPTYGIDRQREDIETREARVDGRPTCPPVRGPEHSATRGCVDGRRHPRIDGQCTDLEVREAGVDRSPLPPAVRALEHAAVSRRIERA